MKTYTFNVLLSIKSQSELDTIFTLFQIRLLEVFAV